MLVHQAKITYTDGTESRFVSEDGEFFYENQFPEKGRGFSPMRYGRSWLKQAATELKSATAIEFTETEV